MPHKVNSREGWVNMSDIDPEISGESGSETSEDNEAGWDWWPGH